MTPIGEFTAEREHPAFPGHFPGAPVLPGVVLLDHVLAAIVAPDRRAAGVPQVKFLRVVRPGDQVEILGAEQDGRVTFTCRVGGDEVARGIVVLGPAL